MRVIYIDASPELADFCKRRATSILPNLEIHIGDPSAEQLPAIIDGFEGVLNGHSYMGRDLLASSQKLREVVFLGTGVSTYVDMPAAQELGIGAHGIAGYGSRTIAEHALGLIFAAVRGIAIQDREIRSGHWRVRGGFELKGKTLGVVGFGNVGHELTNLAMALGMNVLCWARRDIRGLLSTLPGQAQQVQLEELLQSADVVSLHVAHTDQTEHLIDATKLALMKPSAVLVNTARGAIVDEVALIEALDRNVLAHAALDVFTEEPLPQSHPLSTHPKVTLTAHSAWNSPEASERLMLLAFEKMREVLSTPR